MMSKLLVYDFGLFCSLAERLARDGNEVGYFVPYETSFPDGRELVIGQGLEGVERIKYWDDVVDSYDVLVFPDVCCGDMQAYYRRKGYKVWGSGRGSELEMLRWKTKERFKELGLPTGESYKIQGTNNLREFFKASGHDVGWWVKVSGLRGLGETWFARDYGEAKGVIDDFEARNGGLAYLIAFIVEKHIPNAKEIGYDGLNIDGKFPYESMYGPEIKDKAYFGSVIAYSDLPDELQAVTDALEPVLKELQYRNFFSTELRNDICIDLTCRHASPAGECIVENIENLTDVIVKGAEGELVQPIWKYEHAAQIIMCSEWAEEHWLRVSFPEEIRPYVKLYNHCRIDDEGPIGLADYVVPQLAKMKQIGSAIALADDPQEAIDTCKERADMLKAFDLEFEPDQLDKAYESMQEVEA